MRTYFLNAVCIYFICIGLLRIWKYIFIKGFIHVGRRHQRYLKSSIAITFWPNFSELAEFWLTIRIKNASVKGWLWCDHVILCIIMFVYWIFVLVFVQSILLLLLCWSDDSSDSSLSWAFPCNLYLPTSYIKVLSWACGGTIPKCKKWVSIR